MILVLDNYDSFVFNLSRYLERLGQECHVVRNDAIDAAGIEKLRPDAVVISPGPCSPREAGCSLDVVRDLHKTMPILGVCLGHQAIGEAFGGKVVRAQEPMHGRTSAVLHASSAQFTNLPNPFTACRYHSLVVERETLPDCLRATAWTSDGTIMALEHKQYPVVGLQFHPEAILTELGYLLLANFLKIAGLQVPEMLPTSADERMESSPPAFLLPTSPVTF